MKYTVIHDVYGEICCEESFWTSAKTITINGVPLKRVGKPKYGNFTYEYETDEGIKEVTAKGAFTSGINLTIDGETIRIAKRAAWYEIALCALMLTVMLVWSNSVYLCSIFPVLGGGIGGGLNAIFALTALLAMKSTKNIALKIAVWLAVFIGALILNFVLAIILALIFI